MWSSAGPVSARAGITAYFAFDRPHAQGPFHVPKIQTAVCTTTPHTALLQGFKKPLKNSSSSPRLSAESLEKGQTVKLQKSFMAFTGVVFLR